MANKSLFKSRMGKLLPKTDAANHEGAPSYALPPKHALAQLAATGCMNRTFYASAEEQRDRVLALCETIEPAFIARAAVFCRERGFMKDMPALLCAVLSIKDRDLFGKVFERVVDNGKMLRTFVQIVRSGAVGRKSLGSLPKRMIRRWLAARSDAELVKASVGQDPSLGDILRMVHPKPEPGTREALYGWFLGRTLPDEALPDIVRRFEAFKAGRSKDVPDVPFQMLTALPLGTREWTDIARHAPWQATRMNLNAFARHRVFETPGMDRLVAYRLRDKAALARSKVFPYQLMAAYASATREVPAVVRDALQDAMESAIANVPAIEGNVFVFPDVSGSMRSAITGARKGATSAIRCVDVAALVSAAILRKNPRAEVIPFEQDVVDVRLNPRDSVMTNASALAGVGGGGTNCSAPLARLNRRKALGDFVVYVSDNESWVDARAGRGTRTLEEWSVFRGRNPGARMACIDLQPNGTTQAAEREDILNVGGFSDAVFEVLAEFAAGRLDPAHWVGKIESVAL